MTESLSFLLGIIWRSPKLSYHMAFSNMDFHFDKPAKRPSNFNVLKMESYKCSIIMGVTSHYLWPILLASSKSQILTAFKERGLHKDISIQRYGSSS